MAKLRPIYFTYSRTFTEHPEDIERSVSIPSLASRSPRPAGETDKTRHGERDLPERVKPERGVICPKSSLPIP